MITKLKDINHQISHYTQQYLGDLLLFFVRFYVAIAFFKSGWLKLTNWGSTLYLFESEYQVPFLYFKTAAYLGTAAELILPVLLALGVFSQLTASGLFLFNIIAVISYPVIWAGGYYDHKLWGLMMLMTIFYGPGKISVDQLLKNKS